MVCRASVQARLRAVLVDQALARPPVGVEDLDQPSPEPTHQLQQLALVLVAVRVALRRPEEGLILLGQRQQLPPQRLVHLHCPPMGSTSLTREATSRVAEKPPAQPTDEVA